MTAAIILELLLSLIAWTVLAPSTMDAKIAAVFLVGLLLTPASGEYSAGINWQEKHSLPISQNTHPQL